MNVVLITPISILIDSAKLVVEDGGSGTIELMILGQPVRLNIPSTDYVYDILLVIGDRVKLIHSFSSLALNSSGTIEEIIADPTQDRVKVLFDEIYPDQIVKPGEVHVRSTITSLLVELPLEYVEKT